jgi:CDP-glycerol glycerophosphotransferase (TagB/SpsB family)
MLTEKRGSWEFLDEDVVHLLNSLAYTDILISTASTLNLEAAILDKPLISIAFDGTHVVAPALSTARYYGYEHLEPLVRLRGMKLATSRKELIDQVAAYIADPSRDREERKRIVDEVVWRADGKAGERVAHHIMNVLEK